MTRSQARRHVDEGPFFHGTKADLRIGDLLTAGFRSNYRPEVVMNHVYFTALVDGAGLAAELAPGDARPRVYLVEPTGPFEDDPNVTDKKFPGNPTRSYRSRDPLRIVGEVAEWKRQTPQALQEWRDRLAAVVADQRGDIHQLADGRLANAVPQRVRSASTGAHRLQGDERSTEVRCAELEGRR